MVHGAHQRLSTNKYSLPRGGMGLAPKQLSGQEQTCDAEATASRVEPVLAVGKNTGGTKCSVGKGTRRNQGLLVAHSPLSWLVKRASPCRAVRLPSVGGIEPAGWRNPKASERRGCGKIPSSSAGNLWSKLQGNTEQPESVTSDDTSNKILKTL